MRAIVRHLWPVWYFAACMLGGWAAACGLLSETASAWVFVSAWPLWFAARCVDRQDWFLVCVGAAIHGVSFSAIVHHELLEVFSGFLGPIWFCLALLGGIGPVAAVSLFRLLSRGASVGVAIPYFAACWVCGEWIRYWITAGLDGIGNSGLWIGTALVQWPWLAQAADIGGVSILSFVTVALSAGAAASLIELAQSRRAPPARPFRSQFAGGISTAIVAAVVVGYGFVRLSSPLHDPRGVNVTLAACVPADMIGLFAMPIETRQEVEEADIVVFPEGPCDRWGNELWNSDAGNNGTARSDEESRRHGAVVHGSIVVQADQTLNLAITKDRSGTQYQTAKYFPVPVIECQPGLVGVLFARLLPDGIFPILKPDVQQRRDLASCPVVNLDNGRRVQIRPTICYDVFFPTSHWRATNDDSVPAIYAGLLMEGYTTAHESRNVSLRHAQLRAIENRIPYVRSCFGGISAVIDCRGRIVVSELQEKGRWVGIAGIVRAAPSSTIYSRFGEVFAILCGIAVVSARFFQRTTGSVDSQPKTFAP